MSQQTKDDEFPGVIKSGLVGAFALTGIFVFFIILSQGSPKAISIVEAIFRIVPSIPFLFIIIGSVGFILGLVIRRRFPIIQTGTWPLVLAIVMLALPLGFIARVLHNLSTNKEYAPLALKLAGGINNEIMVIMPYRYAGTWVFDDSQAGLVREPFVAGIPEMIDNMVTGIPNATNGFRLIFSARPFPGSQIKLVWLRGDSTGNYYKLDGTDKQGWICPAMFHYYQTAPKELYVKAEPKT